MVDLSSYKSVETGLFARLEIENYRATSGGASSLQVLTFSDYYREVEVNGDTYLPLGKLVNIGNTDSEIRSTGSGLKISLSGIPDSSLQEILYSDIKGSKVSVYRGFFEPNTGDILNITGNPAGRFFGYVNNYSIEEDLEVEELSGTHIITLECSSYINLLKSYVSGRRTNPVDQKELYPGDTSFDRVPNLVGGNYNFGAPK